MFFMNNLVITLEFRQVLDGYAIKSRHHICELEIHGEKLFANKEEADKFVTHLPDFIKQNGYTIDFIYSADETGLVWKALPNKPLVSKNETTALDYKMSKVCVTCGGW